MNELINAIYKGNENEVKHLLERGFNPNQPDQFGRTSLHVASQKNNLEILHMLLKKGANPNIKANEYSGSTPMHFAAISGNVQTLECLTKFGGNLKISNNRGELPIHLGSMFNNYQAVDFLIKKTGNVNILSKSNSSALHFAVSNMNVPAIEALRDNHADFNIRDNNKCTPLHGVFSSWKKDNNGKIDLSTMEILLKSGANPNIGDKLNRAPLHYAARFHDGRMAKKLLEYGADLNIRSKMAGHETPLDIAIKEKNKEVLQVFNEYKERKRMQKTEHHQGNRQQIKNWMQEKRHEERGRVDKSGSSCGGSLNSSANTKSNLDRAM